MGRRILAIIVAAVLALVGGVMVLLYARNADQRAVSAASPKTVYTSSLQIPAGTSIRDALRLQMLTETQIPANGVPAGALTQVTDENASLLALTDIPQGQYVLAASFGDTPVGQKLIQVPTGKLAVSVALSDPARVGSFVTPGSFLTVFATHPVATKGATRDRRRHGHVRAPGQHPGHRHRRHPPPGRRRRRPRPRATPPPPSSSRAPASW